MLACARQSMPVSAPRKGARFQAEYTRAGRKYDIYLVASDTSIASMPMCKPDPVQLSQTNTPSPSPRSGTRHHITELPRMAEAKAMPLPGTRSPGTLGYLTAIG